MTCDNEEGMDLRSVEWKRWVNGSQVEWQYKRESQESLNCVSFLSVLRASGNLIPLICWRSLVRKINLMFLILKLLPIFVVFACEEQVCANDNQYCTSERRLWHCFPLRFRYHQLIKVYQSIYEPATDQVQNCMKTSEIIYDAFTA